MTIALACLMALTTPAKLEMGIVQLVFFTKPASPIQMEASEAEKLQTAHLKFLESLYTTRKALIVGPLMKAGKYEGLIAIDSKTKEEALELLKQDPWIKRGAMGLEAYGWYMDKAAPKKAPHFLDLETMWFGFLRRPDDAPTKTEAELQEIQDGHMANINAMAKSGDLVLAGPIQDKGDFRGVFIFRTKDRKKIEELVARDPAISSGRLKLELFQWMTTKGTLPPIQFK